MNPLLKKNTYFNAQLLKLTLIGLKYVGTRYVHIYLYRWLGSQQVVENNDKIGTKRIHLSNYHPVPSDIINEWDNFICLKAEGFLKGYFTLRFILIYYEDFLIFFKDTEKCCIYW